MDLGLSVVTSTARSRPIPYLKKISFAIRNQFEQLISLIKRSTGYSAFLPRLFKNLFTFIDKIFTVYANIIASFAAIDIICSSAADDQVIAIHAIAENRGNGTAAK